ncbi:ABC transporter ATP-binding protein [Spiroplasma helicoides]|uniref:ABC transporter ATP-binding protein n=1 Tax=Spiroplasma helicoides TaxID=216938 RepID=A0A1B3SKY6_9MOLU|nr:ABC transporter ATP-binding protein [Spiroplasma helicoides]AOG60594.1 ABC transporter ATP-binding protein [Spiroplasma helicoides]
MKELEKDSNNNIKKDNTENVKFKSKKKGSFFKIIFHYLKRHVLVGIAIVIIAIIASLMTVLSPKIIQYMLRNLLAPTSALIIFHSYQAQGKTVDAEAINSGLKDNNVKIIDNGNITEEYLKDSKNYFSDVFGLHLGWMDFIYVQLVMFVILGIATFLTNYVAGIMGKNIEIELRNKTLERLVKQDMSYYSDKKIGEILTKVVSDTQIIGDQAQQVPVLILSALFTFFGSLATLLTIDGYLTLVVLVLMATIFIVLFTTFGIIKKIATKVRKSITIINGDVTDRISTIRLIKASGTENYETERFKEVHKDYSIKTRALIRVQSTVVTILTVGVSSIQIVIVIAAALIYYDNPSYLAITLSSFISGVGTMVGPIMQTTRMVAGLVQASTSSTRINEILASKSILNISYDKDSGIKINDINGDIIFDKVEFSYPEKPEKVILPDFSFTFEKGKSYAFVGETGAGKSTISKLLLRFYDPSKGRVLINNDVDLRNANMASYLDKVGYVEQEPQILYGNVLDNIKYGRFDATDDEAIESAKKANLHDLVMTWPEGYNTILGERGFMLSGGQKQRLVIARMFLKNPQLLILDEATSALDNIVEKEIQKELDKLMVGRTSISIAHRLSTIKNVDKIIVLGRDQGVVQIGTFDELKNKEGHFKKLYEAGLMD